MNAKTVTIVINLVKCQNFIGIAAVTNIFKVSQSLDSNFKDNIKETVL